jgi:hypothetical protein
MTAVPAGRGDKIVGQELEERESLALLEPIADGTDLVEGEVGRRVNHGDLPGGVRGW